jgi:hypothetical protein
MTLNSHYLDTCSNTLLEQAHEILSQGTLLQVERPPGSLEPQVLPFDSITCLVGIEFAGEQTLRKWTFASTIRLPCNGQKSFTTRLYYITDARLILDCSSWKE